MQVLVTLELGPLRARQIARSGGIRSGTVYSLCQRLLDYNYIEKRGVETAPHPGISRPLYGLTQQGTITLARWYDIELLRREGR